MAKELLIYGGINAYSSALFVEKLAEVAAEDDLVVRINTPGGEPEYAWGMIARFAEHKGKKTVKVDGKAMSMGAFWACYADEVEALDVSEFMVHRAAYPKWFESDPEYFTAELRANMERVNKSLRKALEAKIDVAAFEAMKGVKVADLFSIDGRPEVYLSAQEAKKIGLVSRIVKITPAITAEVDSYTALAARQEIEVPAPAKAATVPPVSISSPNNNKMTLAELKAQHPEAYAAAVQVGVDQEKDRVEACLVFIDIDPTAVKTAIESGKPLSSKQMAEFSLKAAAPAALKTLEKEAAPAATTEEVEAAKTAKEKEISDFEAAARKELGITSKN